MTFFFFHIPLPRWVPGKSVQFSCSVMSDSLWPHEWQHARPPCPSPAPGVYSDSSPSSWWCQSSHLLLCHPLLIPPPIPPSIRVFSSESTLRTRAKVLEFQPQRQSFQWTPQDWSPLGWTGWISLLSKGLSRVLSNITVQKHQFFSTQLSSQSNSYVHTWPLEKP